jgi:hypothetical protein
MKKMNVKYISMKTAWLLLACVAMLFSACEKDDDAASSSGPPQLERVSLIAKDSTTHSGKRGEVYVIYGQNLASTQQVFFNEMPAFVNVNYVLDGSIIVRIPWEAPFAGVNNKLKVVTKGGEAELDFSIQQPDPTITSFSPIATGAGEIVTIVGTYFENLQSVKFGDVEAEIVSATPTEIEVKVPDGVASAFIFVTTSAGTVQSVQSFGFKYIIFDDALKAGWTQWGWGGPMDWANTEQVKRGTASMKKTYESGYTGFQTHNNAGVLGLGSYTAIKVSIYGGPGTEGKAVRLVINSKYSDGEYKSLILKEGQWTDYTIPLSEVASPTVLEEVVLQSTDAYIIWIDDLGLI